MNENQTITLLKQRKSVRQFLEQPIEEDILTSIIEAAQQAPNSINAQQTSLIITRDKETIAKIAELAGGQPQVKNATTFITVAIDFYKTKAAADLNHNDQAIQQTLEGILVGSVDGGIMVEALAVAAESYGIGNTVIGGIRNNPAGMIELLNLPEYTFPVVGIALGYPVPNSAMTKPRMAFESFAHYDTYKKEIIPGAVKEYDKTLTAFFESLNLDMPTNSKATSSLYATPYYTDVKPTLLKQGFDTK